MFALYVCTLTKNTTDRKARFKPG